MTATTATSPSETRGVVWLSLEEAARWIDAEFGSRRPMHYETIRDYCHKGQLGVKLQYRRRAWRMVTCVEWLREFIAAVNAKRDAAAAERAAEREARKNAGTRKQQTAERRGIKAAEEQLRARGLM